ncbi:MAG: PspA/IM30 family protein [Bdellovibrionales bacterium]|nr:PspA/IM30 family protein [Bdellovibrionales bacterium]NQZ18292.1 PspA/IM30 family protein [Bdellovibrionales bacterium]
MKHITKLVTTVSARFDQLVGQIENHEAIAEATLKQLKVDIREAYVQHRILLKEAETASNKLTHANELRDKWEKRAKSYGKENKEKALYCLKQFNAQESEIEFWSEKCRELQESAKTLKTQIARFESNYQKLKLQHQKLVSREKSAQMGISLSEAKDNLATGDISDVFERWEKKVIRSEVEGDMFQITADSESIEMDEQEEQLDLEAQLDDLIKE